MRNLKTFIAFLLAIFAGIYIQFANLLASLALGGLHLTCLFFSVAALCIGLFSKKFRIWYLIGFVPMIAAFSTMTIVRNYKHQRAAAIVQKVELFNKQSGRYPSDLRAIESSVTIPGLQYRVNLKGTEYEISYLMDGYNREYYESRFKRWGTLGWN